MGSQEAGVQDHRLVKSREDPAVLPSWGRQMAGQGQEARDREVPVRSKQQPSPSQDLEHTQAQGASARPAVTGCLVV